MPLYPAEVAYELVKAVESCSQITEVAEAPEAVVAFGPGTANGIVV